MKHSISFCVTHYNRWGMLDNVIKSALSHPLVSEIIIVDDASPGVSPNFIPRYPNDKVRTFFNEKNLGCYRNKREAISKASNEWVVIADSDNTFNKEYFDRLESLMVAGVNNTTVYQPEFARPHFDFTAFSGEIVTARNAAYFMTKPHFGTMLNAMNYFVNRDEYLKVWEDRSEPWTADSILQNYNWLKAGNQIYVVSGLQYDHLVHDGSHYKEHVRKTGNLYEEVVSKINALR